MQYDIAPLTLDDVQELAILDDAAMKHWPIAQAMEVEAQKKGTTRMATIIKYMKIGLQKEDPNNVWLKLQDSTTGEMIAAANWGVHLDPESIKPKDDTPPDHTVEKNILQEMAHRWEKVKKQYWDNQPYYYLRILVTHPKHQRKGAGSRLIQWGCEKADEAQVVTVLRASPAGYGVYLRHGFKIVQEEDFDVRPFGVDAIEVSRVMIRQPQPKT